MGYSQLSARSSVIEDPVAKAVTSLDPHQTVSYLPFWGWLLAFAV